MTTVGIVADLHLPWCHPQYLRFCKDTFKRYGVKKVVLIGDVADNHAVAPNYETDPDGFSVGDETGKAVEEVRKWHTAFPGAVVCIGNHDRRHIAAARKAGLSDRFLRDYADIWGTPTWKWTFAHEIDGVLYEHGTGSTGKNAALNRAIEHRQSLVMGHTHSWAGVQFHANNKSRIFAMNVGCGIDARAYAFEYGADFVTRPILSCGIVVDGELPLVVPMMCGRGEKYSRRK